MRIPTRQRDRGLSFNITPLIDIIFLLIIFFLAASHFVRNESQEPIELPEAAEGSDEQEQGLKRLIVTVTGDEQMHVAGRVVALEEVERMILKGATDYPDDFELRLRADREIPFRVVQPVMLACAQSGVSRVRFAVVVK